MKNLTPCCRILPVAIVLALLLCHQSQSSWAQSFNNNKGAPSGGSSSSLSANADVSASNGSGGSAQASGSLNGPSGSASADANTNVGSGGSGGSGGSSSSSSGSRGLSTSSSSSSSSQMSSGSSSSGSTSSNAQINTSSAAQATPAWLSSTPKPEGFFGRIKDAVKTSVENLTTGSAKKEESKSPPSGPSASPSQMPTLGNGDNPAASGTGIMEKMSEAGKKVKDLVKDGAKEVKDDVKTIIGATGAKSDDNNKSGGAGSIGSGGSGGGFSLSGSVKIGESSLGGSSQIGGKTESGSSGGSKQSSTLLAKIGHKFEEKVANQGGKLLGGATTDDVPRGSFSASAQGKLSIGGGKESSGSSGGGASGKAGEQAKLSIGKSNSSIGGGSSGSGDSKSTTGEMFDKVSEVAKAPMEAALKPLDKALGMDKDPLLALYENSHEIMRKQLDMVAKPVEQMFSGAFKTSDEAKKESERLMSEQEKREMRMREDRARTEGRSVLGEIADRTYELVEKPYEIILKPVDRIFGFDKDGQKDPLLKLFEEIYIMSKKPIDVLAKPIENLLRKMGDGEQGYQVSVRVNSESGAAGDPKLFTRLADGALNIAERVMTRSLGAAMRPLGYDGQNNKNPIVESSHHLKNATKVGFELFTKPMDRIVKEISDIGAGKSEAEQEADRERRHQEASRIVRVLDRLKDAAQTPWEIVLRPVSHALGYSRGGKKEPFLKAWDVFHEVLRTPIQVVSKPVEDAFLGEQRHPSRTNVKAEVKIGSKTGIHGKAQMGSATAPASASAGKKVEESRKNIFVDGIKKIEKFAAKPFDKITSPIRKLILGEDGKNSVNAKATVNTPGGKVQGQVGGGSGGGEDKIVHTVENINNVVLKPLGVVTQPISDLLSSDDKNKKGGEVKGQAQVKDGSSGSSSSSQNKVSAGASVQAKDGSSDGGHSKLSAAASAQAKGSSSDGGQNKMSASASAQLKQN